MSSFKSYFLCMKSGCTYWLLRHIWFSRTLLNQFRNWKNHDLGKKRITRISCCTFWSSAITAHTCLMNSSAGSPVYISLPTCGFSFKDLFIPFKWRLASRTIPRSLPVKWEATCRTLRFFFIKLIKTKTKCISPNIYLSPNIIRHLWLKCFGSCSSYWWGAQTSVPHRFSFDNLFFPRKIDKFRDNQYEVILHMNWVRFGINHMRKQEGFLDESGEPQKKLMFPNE